MNLFKKHIVVCVAWICALIPISQGMSLMGGRILEAKDALNFEVTYPAIGGTNKLNIKGIAKDSAYGVRKITTEISGDTMNVKVYLSLISKDSGYLDFTVVVPESVNKVCFGSSQQEIWRRP